MSERNATRKRNAQVQAMVKAWDQCGPRELEIRLGALLMAAVLEPLPSTVAWEGQKMVDRLRILREGQKASSGPASSIPYLTPSGGNVPTPKL